MFCLRRLCRRLKLRIVFSILSAFTILIVIINYVAIKQFGCDKSDEYNADLPLINDMLSFWDNRHLNVSNLNGTTNANQTRASLEFGSILQLAPHFRDRPTSSRSIEPHLVVSKNRTAKIVIGLPTVKRDESYLLKTLNSVIKSCTRRELKDILIVVFIAEINDAKFINETLNSLKSGFKNEINRGIIDIVVPSIHFYPDLRLNKMTRRDFIYNDPVERIRWRTKQNYDMCYLMSYAQNKAPYYLQLEDDVLSRNGFVTEILTYLEKIESDTEMRQRWLSIAFSPLGFIGKLFRTRDLNMFISVFLIFAQVKPIDIVMDNLIEGLSCDFSRPKDDCRQKFEKAKITYSPSLFQHIGIKSSLKGKIQNLKDTRFNGKRNKNIMSKQRKSGNPPAKFNISLRTYLHYGFEKAYNSGGEKYFWAFNSNSINDFIVINFEKPFCLKYYVITSGSGDHPDDIIPYDSTLEVKPSVASSKSMKGTFAKTNDGYFMIASFSSSNGNGCIDNLEATELNISVSSIRILIRGPTKNWILISEIGFY